MDIQELISTLTEGLDADQAKIVKAAIERDAVKTKAAGWKQAQEYQALADRETALKAELDGEGPQKPGAKAYREWYEKNYATVVQLQKDKEALVAKYENPANPKTDPVTPAAGLSDADIQRIVDKRIQEGYAPRWSDLLTKTGTIVQKHMYAKRTTPIDFAKVSELAAQYGGDLEKGYEEWDRPEREKFAKAETDKEIERRVNEELQKRGASQHFPAGADASPGILSRDRDTSKFDKAAMERDLVQTFIRGTDSEPLTGFGVN